MHEILSALLRAIDQDQAVALATLIETRGSTPQVTGASALFTAGGLFRGTLGGGLLEARGQQRALEALHAGGPVMFRCDLMSDIADAEGAICGGSALILIDDRPAEHAAAFRDMASALKEGAAGALITNIAAAGGEGVRLHRHWVSEAEAGGTADGAWYSAQLPDIARAIASGRAVILPGTGEAHDREESAKQVSVIPVYPPPHLIITGAGHVGRALAHYAARLDFRVTVIDDREELANSTAIPEADSIIVDAGGAAIARLPIHRDTYIVIVNRGHRGDAEVLRQCIASDAAYIGMIGSTRKIAQMRLQFIEEQWATPAQFDRVHAPVGMDIDAETVEEIAVSIAAELVAVRAKLRGAAR